MKKLMDGHDLKILNNLVKKNEILERQLNVNHDEEDEDLMTHQLIQLKKK